MIFDGGNELDVKRAQVKFNELLKKHELFELKSKSKRSLSQNNYLHLALSVLALEIGETVEYVKQEIFKKIVNKDIFQYERVNRKTGEVRIDLKSTKHLTKAELSIAIERFRNYSINDCYTYIPEPSDLTAILQITVEVERNKQWL